MAKSKDLSLSLSLSLSVLSNYQYELSYEKQNTSYQHNRKLC